MSEAIDYYALPEQPVRNLTPVPARGLIEISNVSKFFGKHKALDDVSLTLQPGTVTVILGLPAPENRRCCGRSTIWSASTRGLSASTATTSATAARATGCTS